MYTHFLYKYVYMDILMEIAYIHEKDYSAYLTVKQISNGKCRNLQATSPASKPRLGRNKTLARRI